MRFRIKSGQSARRFVFDRTPAPAKPPQPRGSLKKQTRPLTQSCRTALCGSFFCRGRTLSAHFCFLFLSFYAGVI